MRHSPSLQSHSQLVERCAGSATSGARGIRQATDSSQAVGAIRCDSAQKSAAPDVLCDVVADHSCRSPHYLVATNVPETRMATADRPTIQPATRAAGAARIALIEDDPHLALLMEYNLRAHGYEVDALDEGWNAISHLRKFRPQLVVLDWLLPGLAGIEVLRRLRAEPDLCTLPVVMVTANVGSEHRARAMAAGADAFFGKPASIHEVMTMIGKLLHPGSEGLEPTRRSAVCSRIERS